MNVLLSIKPKYVERIFQGEKKYEFRKRIFTREDINRVYIYCTSPVKKIVASFSIKEIKEGTPEELWKKLKDQAGIGEEDFFNYFRNKNKGYAIRISNLNKLEDAIDPKNIYSDFTAPQSFCYTEKSFHGVS